MNELLSDVLTGFWTIISSPAQDWSVLWLIAPIISFWVMLEIYFDRHKKEELGWNTALGNGLSLFWVAISCVKFIVAQDFTMEAFWRTFWIFLIFTYSLIVIWASFTHRMKKSIVYLLASPTPIYFLSMVIVLFAYGVLDVTWIILLDLFLMYWIILGIEVTVRHFMPGISTAEDDNFSSPSSSPASGAGTAGNAGDDPFKF